MCRRVLETTSVGLTSAPSPTSTHHETDTHQPPDIKSANEDGHQPRQRRTVQSVCLGLHWQPYAYIRTADDTDGAPVKPLPPNIARLGCRAVTDTFGPSAGSEFEPDAVIANLYAPGARLGLHQDLEEPSPLRS